MYNLCYLVLIFHVFQDIRYDELKEFTHHGVNISSFRLVDPTKPQVVRVLSDWRLDQSRRGKSPLMGGTEVTVGPTRSDTTLLDFFFHVSSHSTTSIFQSLASTPIYHILTLELCTSMHCQTKAFVNFLEMILQSSVGGTSRIERMLNRIFSFFLVSFIPALNTIWNSTEIDCLIRCSIR